MGQETACSAIVEISCDRNKLAEDNVNLIYGFMRKHGLDEDVYDICAIGYMGAVRIFDPNKGSFSSLAYKCMQHSVWNASRVPKSRTAVIWELDRPVIDEEDEEPLINFIEDLESRKAFENSLAEPAVDRILSLATVKQLEFLYYTIQGINGIDCAEICGCTKQNVSIGLKRLGDTIRKADKVYPDMQKYNGRLRRGEDPKKRAQLTRSIKYLLFN